MRDKVVKRQRKKRGHSFNKCGAPLRKKERKREKDEIMVSAISQRLKEKGMMKREMRK